MLYVAPTVIVLGLIPGLPIVSNSGPWFPAATITTIIMGIQIKMKLSLYNHPTSQVRIEVITPFRQVNI